MSSVAAKRAPVPGVAAPLGGRAASGLAWSILNLLCVQVAGFVGNLVLAYLLMPRDFGLVGLTYTVAMFAGLINQLGVRELLIRRHARFDLWATPGMWLSLAGGVVCALVMAGAAPIAALIYGKPELTGLILVAALTAPLTSLAVVPEAKLQADMRFGLMMIYQAGATVLNQSLAVLLAWRGFGAYSFILPLIVVGIVRLVVVWRATGVRVHWRPHLHRWRFLVVNGGWFFATSLAAFAVLYGDYLTLGLVAPAEVVGLYYFAFLLASQPIALLAGNLTNVLLPALSRLQRESERQMAALLRSLRAVGLILVPGCLGLAAAADPVVHLLFQPKWEGCIPLLQLLCIGMSLRFLSLSGRSLMMTRGRLRAIFILAAVNVLVFFALVIPGALLGKQVGTAMAVAVFFLLTEPIGLYIALRPSGRGWADVLGVVWGPIVIGLGAAGAAWYAGSWVPLTAVGQSVVDAVTHAAPALGRHVSVLAAGRLVELLAMGAAGAIVFFPLARLLMPQTWAELSHRARELLGKALGRVGVR